jgi:Redoxin
MSHRSRPWVGVLFLSLFACARPSMVSTRLASSELVASNGTVYAVPARADGVRLTVLVFSAWHCPCQTAHDARVRELYARYHARGVDFFAVDSEVKGEATQDATHARERGYDFPVLLDAGAGLARALHAEYATESFVIDPLGIVRYHGGLDTDRTTIHDDAMPLLANALDDLLAGRPPRSAESKTLGCALQIW